MKKGAPCKFGMCSFLRCFLICRLFIYKMSDAQTVSPDDLVLEFKLSVDASLAFNIGMTLMHSIFVIIFTRKSSYCFWHVLAIAILSVRPSVCLTVCSFDTSLYHSQCGAMELLLCDPDREFGICILT